MLMLFDSKTSTGSTQFGVLVISCYTLPILSHAILRRRVTRFTIYLQGQSVPEYPGGQQTYGEDGLRPEPRDQPKSEKKTIRSRTMVCATGPNIFNTAIFQLGH